MYKIKLILVCGGHLQATSRVKHFYSHSKYGDDNYDNRADCDWSIEAERGKNVQLTFLTFEIESEDQCGYDYVDVYNGLDDSGQSYGRFCGNSVSTLKLKQLIFEKKKKLQPHT